MPKLSADVEDLFDALGNYSSDEEEQESAAKEEKPAAVEQKDERTIEKTDFDEMD